MNRSTAENQAGKAAPVVADYATIEPVRCPCGRARRAFADVPDAPASVHRVEDDAHTHYRRERAEIYYILECAAGAAIEFDSEPVALGAGHAVVIPPGVQHLAVGRMIILNIRRAAFRPDRRVFRSSGVRIILAVWVGALPVPQRRSSQAPRRPAPPASRRRGRA